MKHGMKKMLHTLVDGPEQVAFDVTQSCNLKCVHCFNNSGADAPMKDLPREKKLDIARQIAEMRPKNVCMCGGETTCCPYLFEIIDILRPNVGNVSLVSNGYSMTEELARSLKAHGVGQVQISIDGAEPWQHDSFRGVPGSFSRAVGAVKFLKKAGIKKIDTSLVPNRLNFRAMDAYAAMCHKIGVSEIRMMPFLPSGRGKSVGRSLMLDARGYFEFQRTVERLKSEYEGRLDFLWGDPIDHMRRMPVNAKIGIKTCVMEIKTDGDLVFTSYLPVVAGNVERGTLREYWEAGYGHVWGDELFTRYTERIRTIYDLETFEPSPYSGEKIVIDLLENRNEISD